MSFLLQTGKNMTKLYIRNDTLHKVYAFNFMQIKLNLIYEIRNSKSLVFSVVLDSAPAARAHCEPQKDSRGHHVFQMAQTFRRFSGSAASYRAAEREQFAMVHQAGQFCKCSCAPIVFRAAD